METTAAGISTSTSTSTSASVSAITKQPWAAPGLVKPPKVQRLPDMQRVAKVALVLRLGQPGGLTGGLAGAPTAGGGAKALTFAVTMIWIKKFAATQALTLSRLRHDRSRFGGGNSGSGDRLHALGRSLKNSESNAKKMRQRRRSEENGNARRCTFTPADLRQFRLGVHSLPHPALRGLVIS